MVSINDKDITTTPPTTGPPSDTPANTSTDLPSDTPANISTDLPSDTPANTSAASPPASPADKPVINPVKLVAALSRRGRIMAGAGLLLGLVAVSLSQYAAPMGVLECLSAYVSVLCMCWLAVTDATSLLMPNRILLIWLACRTVFIVLIVLTEISFETLLLSVGGAVVVGLLFLLAHYLSRRTLGGGDVKLSFVLGLSMTLREALNVVFYGIIACALFALAGMALKKLSRKDAVPLGPFLYLGMLLTFLARMGG